VKADGVLVRFGEIGIKSPPVRAAMLERLRANLLDLMQAGSVEGDVQRLGARLWMVGPDAAALLDVARRTFGVVSASPARLVPANVAAIGEAAAQAALAARPWTRFAVRARREGTHPFTSQVLNVEVGSAVFRAAEAAGRAPVVDLDDPELEVHVDVRAERAFVFTDETAGPGGLPLGSQGRVLVLLSDAASAVAAWLVARRGCRIAYLHAGQEPSVPRDLVATLAAWGLPRDVALLETDPDRLSKAALLEAAATVAADLDAQALVTGETLSSRLVAGPMPVLRPVCGLEAAEVDRFRAMAGLPPPPRGAGEAHLEATGGAGAERLLLHRRRVRV
jgi:tRNA uracil 4-sulfurtransferase